MDERVAAAGRLMIFMVVVVGLCLALVYGCSLVLDDAVYGDHRDTSRCPDLSLVQGAEEVRMDLGGYGNPDWCIYYDEAGKPIKSLLPQ